MVQERGVARALLLVPYCDRFALYFFKFIIPQRPSVNSNASPAENGIDGIPSIIKLLILPVAKPTIKKTFVIVAVRQ